MAMGTTGLRAGSNRAIAACRKSARGMAERHPEPETPSPCGEHAPGSGPRAYSVAMSITNR